MNTLKKLSTGAILGVLALTSTAPARATEVFRVSLPDLSIVTSEIGRSIAANVTAQLRAALKAPRVQRQRQSPSVSITEEDAMVVVVAKRLPSIDTMEAMRVAGSTQVRL
jgi:hypothetical protein